MHDPKFEQFARHQTDHSFKHSVAGFLGFVRQGLYRTAFFKAHRKDMRTGQRVKKLWHDKAGVRRQSFPIKPHLLALAQIIGLFLELLFCCSQQRRNVQFLGQQTRQAQQAGDIIDIGIDAARNAGILNFDCQCLAIAGHRFVNLPNGCSGNGARVEPFELCAPIAAPFSLQHTVKLPGGHKIGFVAHGGQDLRQFWWQNVASIHADHLPHFHCRAAQMGQSIGQSLRIGWC